VIEDRGPRKRAGRFCAPEPGAPLPRSSITSHNEWILIINRETGQWGTDYEKAQDLGRVPMKVAALDEPIEQFTIAIQPRGGRSSILTLTWDTTQASVAIRVEK
jgi:Protein of unknown function (DUF2911)